MSRIEGQNAPAEAKRLLHLDWGRAKNPEMEISTALSGTDHWLKTAI